MDIYNSCSFIYLLSCTWRFNNNMYLIYCPGWKSMEDNGQQKCPLVLAWHSYKETFTVCAANLVFHFEE